MLFFVGIGLNFLSMSIFRLSSGVYFAMRNIICALNVLTSQYGMFFFFSTSSLSGVVFRIFVLTKLVGNSFRSLPIHDRMRPSPVSGTYTCTVSGPSLIVSLFFDSDVTHLYGML